MSQTLLSQSCDVSIEILRSGVKLNNSSPRKNGSYPKGHRFTQLCAIVKNYLGVQRELGIYTQSRECMGLELAERSAGSQSSGKCHLISTPYFKLPCLAQYGVKPHTLDPWIGSLVTSLHYLLTHRKCSRSSTESSVTGRNGFLDRC
jgi:hypothetical protein